MPSDILAQTSNFKKLKGPAKTYHNLKAFLLIDRGPRRNTRVDSARCTALTTFLSATFLLMLFYPYKVKLEVRLSTGIM